MSDIKKIIEAHSIKHHNQLKKLCSPLSDLLGITIFSHFFIESDGKFGTLTNQPDFLDYYFKTDQHLINPYLSHPHLFRSGYDITPGATYHPDFMKLMEEKFSIHRMFIIAQQKGDRLECSLFANRDQNFTEFFSLLIPKISLLQTFVSYFRRGAKNLMHALYQDNFNLKEEKRDEFFEPKQNLPLLNNNTTMNKFLKSISPLTFQEKRCLELFKQGNSSQSTAAILGISPRTVETHFEHIKEKLGCTSKWELLEW